MNDGAVVTFIFVTLATNVLWSYWYVCQINRTYLWKRAARRCYRGEKFWKVMAKQANLTYEMAKHTGGTHRN